jgi:uncharacterized SAM-binding protein YcdF (DUF218 family)
MDEILNALKNMIEALFSPMGIMVLLLVSGIILSLSKKHSTIGRRALICGALLFLIVFLTPLCPFLVCSLERQYPPLLTPPESPKTARIVVLAGYAEEHPEFPITSRLSQTTIGSISEGLRQYRLVPDAKLIFSGGVVRKGEKPVAEVMSEFVQQIGVPASDVIVEGKSRNTYENLLEVNKLIGSDPFILVAQACDMMRAVAVARKLKMKPIPAPSNYYALPGHPEMIPAGAPLFRYFRHWDIPSSGNFHRLQWVYHEYLGYLWYRILGRV